MPPRHEIVAVENPGDNELNDPLETVLNRAFVAAERQLEEVVERRRGDVKTHREERALVVRTFPDQDYGFLKTEQGREIYFHRNSVPDDEFDRLTVGTEVRFEETMGEMGPQATTVQRIGKPGQLAGKGGDGVELPPGWRS
ncbi:MAG TPA: cold shock domain-containing protein [Thermoanaerobaculia bacterium]|nr:cold shock domain-containing protein [Thermoanaerobaculia bacterium]